MDHARALEAPKSDRRGSTPARSSSWLWLSLLLAAGALMARRNYVQGKSDVRGAFRLASAVFVIDMAIWVCLDHFLPTLATFAPSSLPSARHCFSLPPTWMLYVALEPYVRRHWPHAIISWSRLLAGELRDPLVGRDILGGVLLGVLWSVIVGVGFLFLKREGATPATSQHRTFDGRPASARFMASEHRAEHLRHSSVFLPDFPAEGDSAQQVAGSGLLHWHLLPR